MPFDYRNKRTFAVKLVLFLGTGFAIPFGAAYYQLYVDRKQGSAAEYLRASDFLFPRRHKGAA